MKPCNESVNEVMLGLLLIQGTFGATAASLLAHSKTAVMIDITAHQVPFVWSLLALIGILIKVVGTVLTHRATSVELKQTIVFVTHTNLLHRTLPAAAEKVY